MSASASPLTRKQEWYKANAEKARADSRAFHQRKRPHVSDDDLLRLRLPENRLEALNYGEEKKQQVCLNCGAIFDGNFSRHPSGCLVNPQISDAYREQWGYEKSNPLASVEWQHNASASKRTSEKFRAAQERNRPAVLTAFAARRARIAEANKRGEPTRRGPMRLEAILRRSAGQRGRPRKLRKPHVTDAQIEKILALDLTIAEGARRVGLSKAAFYSRAKIRHGWNSSDVKSRRSLVNKYVFELGRWVFSQQKLPTVQDVIDRHVAGVRSDMPDLFQKFRPFFPHMEAELSADPKWLAELADRKLAQLKGNRGQLVLANVAIALASKVFHRVRAVPGPDSGPKQKRARGPRPTKRDLFEKGLQLRNAGKSWGVIAKTLDPEGFAKNQRAAADRLRVGIESLRKKRLALPTNP